MKLLKFMLRLIKKFYNFLTASMRPYIKNLSSKQLFGVILCSIVWYFGYIFDSEDYSYPFYVILSWFAALWTTDKFPLKILSIVSFSIICYSLPLAALGILFNGWPHGCLLFLLYIIQVASFKLLDSFFKLNNHERRRLKIRFKFFFYQLAHQLTSAFVILGALFYWFFKYF